MSSDTIPGDATTPPIDTSDWVVSGTPTADPDALALDWPSEDQPVPFVYPDVCVGISVPAAAAVDAVELIRIRIAAVPTGVPSAVPGMPAAPVGIRALRIRDTRAWSIAAITAPVCCRRAAEHRCRRIRGSRTWRTGSSAAPRSPRARRGPAPASPGRAPTRAREASPAAAGASGHLAEHDRLHVADLD